MTFISEVKPAPKTNLESWNRWLNNMQTKSQQAPWAHRKKIEVKQPCPGWDRACGKPIALETYICDGCMPEEDE